MSGKEMGTLEIIDTFPAFLDYWQQCRDLPLDAQVARWAQVYLSSWPELLALQIEDYREQDVDWQTVAREKVFPFLPERLPVMQEARDNLLGVSRSVYRRALDRLGISIDATFVIHVGIGGGAGWVTRYRDQPAILFGLENIAECGWQSKEAIKGLVAHELGHLAQAAWREQQQRPMGSGPWWQLYEEGFAQYCEGLLSATPTWHQMQGDADWLAWCQANQGWLAGEFLRRVDAGEAVTPLFGSWFDLRGMRQTGYYLGWEMMRQLGEELTLEELAVLDDPQAAFAPILRQWVTG